MNFLHYLTNDQGFQVESVYSRDSNKKLSLICLAKIKGLKYNIWDRINDRVLKINIKNE